MGLKANMSRTVDQNVEEIDLPICRGILANMSTNFFELLRVLDKARIRPGMNLEDDNYHFDIHGNPFWCTHVSLELFETDRK